VGDYLAVIALIDQQPRAFAGTHLARRGVDSEARRVCPETCGGVDRTLYPIRSMSPIRRYRSLASAVLLASAACTNDARQADSVRADSARRASVGATLPRAASAGAPTDAGPNGLWSTASLEKRLDLQGMAPRRLPAPVRHSFLAVAGTAYQLGNAELQVFIYDDTAAVARDVSRLDTITVSPLSEPVQWPKKATLVTNANLAAILLSDSPLQIERVQRALMAGTGSTVLLPAAPPR